MRSVLIRILLALPACATIAWAGDDFAAKPRKVTKSEAEWARQLTREQFLVTRKKATEPAFSGKYLNNHAKGIYACVGCESELFSSRTKFNSGTGWPSFWQPVAMNRIETHPDYSSGEPRVEVLCSTCGAHLGHVFDDGPPPTGLRYCMNSVALKFVKEGAKPAAKAKTSATAEKAKETEKPAATPEP